MTDVAPSVNGEGMVTVPVNVGEASGAYAVDENAFVPSVPPAPMLSVEPSVPANVSVFETVNVFDVVPPATAKPVAFAVNERPFTVVAVAAPRVGVTRVGEVVRTTFPDPLVAVTDKAPVPPDVVTIPFEVKFESVAMFCYVFTVIVFVVRVRPVENVNGTSYADAAVYAAVPSVPPVPTLSVEPSVPARVKLLETFNFLPVATASAKY